MVFTISESAGNHHKNWFLFSWKWFVIHLNPIYCNCIVSSSRVTFEDCSMSNHNESLWKYSAVRYVLLKLGFAIVCELGHYVLFFSGRLRLRPQHAHPQDLVRHIVWPTAFPLTLPHQVSVLSRPWHFKINTNISVRFSVYKYYVQFSLTITCSVKSINLMVCVQVL